MMECGVMERSAVGDVNKSVVQGQGAPVEAQIREQAIAALGKPPSKKAAQVLKGALQVFLEQGYAGASMDRIASVAGVSKATVYSHFRDKEGLFEALVQQLARDRLPRLFQAVQQGSARADASPRDCLRQLCTAVLDRMTEDPLHFDFLRLTLGESGRFPQLAQVFVKNFTSVGIRAFTEILGTYPALKGRDVEAITRIIIGSLIAYVMTQHILHGQQVVPMEQGRIIDSIVDLVLPLEQNRDLKIDD